MSNDGASTPGGMREDVECSVSGKGDLPLPGGTEELPRLLKLLRWGVKDEGLLADIDFLYFNVAKGDPGSFVIRDRAFQKLMYMQTMQAAASMLACVKEFRSWFSDYMGDRETRMKETAETIREGTLAGQHNLDKLTEMIMQGRMADERGRAAAVENILLILTKIAHSTAEAQAAAQQSKLISMLTLGIVVLFILGVLALLMAAVGGFHFHAFGP